MHHQNEKDADNKTASLLNEVFRDEIKRSKASEHRRQFAVGLLLLAPICGSMAALGWLQENRFGSGLFFWAAVVLMMFGGWHFDKANKERNGPGSDKHLMPDNKGRPASPIRRIK